MKLSKLILGLSLAVVACASLLISVPLASADPASSTTSNIIYAPMSDDGWQAGDSAADKVGFHDKAPTIQRTDASQAAVTDNTTGTVSDTFAATIGQETIAIPVTLAAITAAGDVLTTYTPGYKFKILRVDFAVAVAATTAAKAASLNIEIGTTNLTGGVVALTSANCTPLGATVLGTAVTAANSGAATDSISIEASSVTAFAEGSGYVLLKIQNMDTVDAFTTIADKLNEWRTTLVNKGLATGS